MPKGKKLELEIFLGVKLFSEIGDARFLWETHRKKKCEVFKLRLLYRLGYFGELVTFQQQFTFSQMILT
jgi:hypothetical protein